MVDRFFLRLLLLGLAAVVCWVLFLLQPVILPFVTAAIFAYILNPLVEFFCKLKMPRWLAISKVFIGLTLLLIWACWYLVPILWKQAVFIRDNIPVAIKWINNVVLPWVSTTFNVERMRLDVDQITPVVMSYIQTNYNYDSIQTFALQLAKSGLNFLQVGGLLILIPIITFYFLLDWHKMLARLQQLIPIRYKDKTLLVAQECDMVLRAFIKGQFLVMFLLGTIYGTGLQLIGLEVGIMIGMIAGFASIIPYAGFAVGIIAALFATLFQFGFDWLQILFVFLVFLAGQLCEGYILQPFLLGDKIGLSPVAVVFSVLAGAQLGGFVGMLIALPVAAILVVLLHHLKEYYQQSTWFTRPMRNINTTALLIEQEPSAAPDKITNQDDDTVTTK